MCTSDPLRKNARKPKWSKEKKRRVKRQKADEKLKILHELFLYRRPEAVSWEKAAIVLKINIAGLDRVGARAKVNGYLRQVLENYDRARQPKSRHSSPGNELAAALNRNLSSKPAIMPEKTGSTSGNSQANGLAPLFTSDNPGINSFQNDIVLPKQLSIPRQFSTKVKTKKFSFLRLKNSGIQTQLDPDAESENEITIGLDFGTSSVKVVVRDLNGNTFLVPFGNMGVSTANYLLPTRLYECNGVYSLSQGDQVWRDLKLSLMDNSHDENAQIRAVSFLALVLRHVRGWVFDNLSALYRSEYLIWGINIGLPAKSYDNKQLVETFRKVGIAAANASADQTKFITTHLAKSYLRLSTNELNALKKGQQPSEMPFMADMIEVVPEIAAQISGYVRSGSWDRKNTMMMLVDIGAGTVDASVFTVVKPAQFQFAFLSASVTPHGVMNLHRWRVQWLKEEIESLAGAKPFVQYLDEICLPTDQLQGIPESWRDYIPGLQYNPYSDVDKQFYAEYRSQLFDKTIRQGKALNPLTPEWQGLPIFLCGGGKSMELYKQFISKVNNQQSGSRIRLVPKLMPKPANLLARGVIEQDYHRFSVAYGLSYSRELIGKCIPTAKIPPFTRRMVVRKSHFSVTKDMM